MSKRNTLRFPRKLLSLSNSGITPLIIAGIGAVAVWYFGINQSTRQFDLLGMLNLGGSQPTITQDQIPLDPIDVVNQINPSNSGVETPMDSEESQLKMTNTISGAYMGRVYNARFSADDIIPKTVSMD